MQINDPRSGMAADVNEEGQLKTRSIASSFHYAAAEDGTAYIADTDFMALTSGAQRGILELKGSATSAMTHTRLITMQSTADVKWRLILSESGGAVTTSGTALTPQNMKRGSGNTYSGTLFKGSNAIAVSGGSVVMTGLSGANRPCVFDFQETLILGKSQKWTLSAEVVSAGGDVSAGVQFYEHDAIKGEY
ncbi:MAG: hypothetical protein HQL91_13925 [Magnetococcales bacterium]|nr:hypothetical protein [Magnetococcales bacterium]